ncbi:type I polyketide synthase [bacterium]|nr:type I polyketide synthase [bacterium]
MSQEGLEQLTPLQRALLALKELRTKFDALERSRSESIAIVGMACRFPGQTNSAEAFWQLLAAGRDGISEVPPERWSIEEYYDPNPEAPGKMYTRRSGFIEGIEQFDPRFFGIAPREALSMDPQQRLLLEVTWEALEHAGLVPERLFGTNAGVFVGISTSDYAHLQMRHADLTQMEAYGGTGNAFSVAAGRLSYVLGLQGPNLAVDTACSSSLVTIHLACQSLRLGECRLALAGGVNAILSPDTTINFCRARMLAPDGRCKTFDAAADGYVRGEGCGMVVLKRLSDALADGDNIFALIRGSAINQDGRSNGLTAPSGPAQEAVLRAALSQAGVTPQEVDYVEAHGTGTALGDPIELHALANTMCRERPPEQPLLVGSAKTNIGHLEAAAGIAGLIKVALALHHEYLPPHLHFQQLNPHVAIGGAPLEILKEGKAWPRRARPRLAGVSSFGFSGTNAHIILQEAPAASAVPAAAPAADGMQLLTLSAKTEKALRDLARRYAEFLHQPAAPALAEVCYSANTTRSAFVHRLGVVAVTLPALREKLAAFAEKQSVHEMVTGQAKENSRPKVAFLFTGQGAQYLDMGRRLYETQAVFREALEKCDALLRPHLDKPLLAVLFSNQSSVISDQSSLPTDNRSLITDHWLHQTAYTQPALFAIEYALAELWRAWGVKPAAVMGHSVGEYVAACIAGMLSLEDGLKLIASRGRLMQVLPQNGEMAAIFAEEERVAAALADFRERVSLAAINGPANVVISGEAEAVHAVLARFDGEGVKWKRLVVSHAFHSPLMAPMLDEFEMVAGGLEFQPAKIPLISNLTAKPLQFDAGHTPRRYWRRHVREAVRFADSLRTLHEMGCRLFLEIGPHPTLLGMASQCLPTEAAVWIPSLRRGHDDTQQMLKSLGLLFVNGVEIDWEDFHREAPRRRVVLPTYPFQHERFWLAPPSTPAKTVAIAASEARPQSDDWLFELAWQPQPLAPQAPPAQPGVWLIFADQGGLGFALKAALEQAGESCLVVLPGEKYERSAAGVFRLALQDAGQYQRLLQEASAAAAAPLRAVIHLWSLDDERLIENFSVQLEAGQQRVCGSALFLAQSLAKMTAPPRLCLITRGAMAVPAARGPLALTPAALWGLGRALALEHPELRCLRVDLDPDADTAGAAQSLSEELRNADRDDQVALRAGQRYVARLARVEWPAAAAERAASPALASPPGAILITGGTAGLGLQLAQWLVAQGNRQLVLVSRRPPAEPAAQAIAELQQKGATVLVKQADVANADQLAEVLAEIQQKLPPLRGVIHAAGVLDDRPLLKQDWPSFAKVMAPKISGAWNLHVLTQELPLEFFVMFSSAAALLGSPGQSNYAAANAFMDSLAHHRRGLGRPALSINWGPWAEAGMAAALGEAHQNRFASLGISPIPLVEGLRLFGRLRAETRPQIAVLPLQWQTLLTSLPAGSEPPLLAPLLQEMRGRPLTAAAQPRSELLEKLAKTAAKNRSQVVFAHVLAEACRVLGIDPAEAPDPHQPLQELGLDSLMAVELRNALAAALGQVLPATLLFEYPTIASLAEFLTNQVLAPAVSSGNGVAAEQPRPAVLQEIQNLSQQEVDDALAAELRELEGLLK